MSRGTTFYAIGLSYKKADAEVRGHFSLDEWVECFPSWFVFDGFIFLENKFVKNYKFISSVEMDRNMKYRF